MDPSLQRETHNNNHNNNNPKLSGKPTQINNQISFENTSPFSRQSTQLRQVGTPLSRGAKKLGLIINTNNPSLSTQITTAKKRYKVIATHSKKLLPLHIIPTV